MREFGVNTVAYLWALQEGLDQTELLSHIYDNGGTIAEVRREFLKKEQIEAIARRGSALGMTIYYSVPEPLLLEQKVNDEMFQEVMKEAKELNAKCVKFSLGDFRGVSDEEVKKLSDFVEKSGQNVLIENGPKGPEGDAGLLEAFFEKQDEIGGTVGLTFDTGNFVAAGFDPLAEAKKLAGKTRWIHLKDAKEKDGQIIHPMLGEGDIDFKVLLPLFGTEVPAAIEYPCEGYGCVAAEMKKAQVLLKQCTNCD